MYKPTFCCDCGERIERLNWNILTNRRFCEFCETEHGLDSLIRKVGLVMLGLFGLFGLGSFLSAGGGPTDTTDTGKTRTVEKSYGREGTGLMNPRVKDVAAPVRENETLTDPKDTQTIGAEEKKVPGPVRVKNPPLQKETDEPVYMCGAATKKGTPCSRRVKGGGRCWQHLGKEAILPEKELRIEP
ncbi:MAG: hypothetical protein KDB79_09410 [Acidobacteria bacterium]|nr:hypothetical protein [Acidobacteriota bacterium]